MEICRGDDGGMQQPKVNPSGSYLLRLEHECRAELDRGAAEAGLPLQHYIELQLFGRVLPRKRPGRPRLHETQAQIPGLAEEGNQLGLTA